MNAGVVSRVRRAWRRRRAAAVAALALICASVLAPGGLANAAGDAGAAVAPVPVKRIIPKEDVDAVLHNPDMGWVVYENYPVDPRPGGSSNIVELPDYDWPGVDYVAIMFAWSDVEKAEGVYDFSKVEFAYDWWRSRGKKIHLRLSTESLLWWNHAVPASGLGVPRYVIDRLPPESVQVRTMEGRTYVVVDAREPYYLARLRAFLEEVARRFSDERPVELIDLRGFGVWGEWHSGFQYPTVEDRREALKAVLEAYSESFPDHTLALSYSYDPDGPPAYYAGATSGYNPLETHEYEGYVRYSAFDVAMELPNVTLRRDGAGSAVRSNERRLAAEVFYRMEKGPFMSEFAGSYEDFRARGRLRFAIDDALSLYPNYVSLVGWQSHSARAFLENERELFEHGLRTMGYRLVPLLIEYPEVVPEEGRFPLDSVWTNRGVGRAIEDYRLKVILKGGDGEVALAYDAGNLGTHRWVKGNEYRVRSVVSGRGVPPGTYDLYIAVVDPRTGEAIALPLFDGGGEGAYRIGTVDVGPVSEEAVFAGARPAGEPGPFRHVAPAMRSAFVPLAPVFEWEAADGATHYRLVVSKAPDLSEPVLEVDALQQAFYRSGIELEPFTTYYWRVEARNASGSTPAYNSVFEFTTGRAESAVGAEALRFDMEGDSLPEGLVAREAAVALTREPGEVLSGGSSLRFASYGAGHEWVEYLWTDPELPVFQSGGNFRIRFRYKVLDQPAWGGAQFYALVRVNRTTDFTTDRGATFFGGPGTSGEVEIEVFLDPGQTYYLLLGSRYDNATLVIDDLVIEKLQ